ncbi:MAG: adenosylcobalamin-dependent ribonucleoside-diphosphate reductase [Alphaproteobacteria bacterium]|nr:adenosylcobalamin-dependent ribonucleoside-diphosphate reductase [Alphaproteobacteria bacterium]
MNARELSSLIWSLKYRLRGERRIADTFRRVAGAVASAEADRPRWTEAYLALLESGQFIPGGRILANAGDREGETLCNCFVSGEVSPSLETLMEHLRDVTSTLASGGGVGADVSPLGPKGTTDSRGRPHTDPLSYLRLLNSAAEAFPAGRRRHGALMASLSCRHPDIEAFVSAQGPDLSHFALSVQISDEFMNAAIADRRWRLRHPEGGGAWIRARDLLTQIASCARRTGTPGVLFIDRINDDNTLWWRERLTTTNPCGEAPMPAHGACTLGSLNLCAFVIDPFGPAPQIDWPGLESASAAAIRFLDAVLDLTPYPLPAQRDEASAVRRVGLGVTGLGDALVLLGVSYSSSHGRHLAQEIMKAIRDFAYKASVDLGVEKGSFPALDRNKFLQGGFARRLPETIRQSIRRYGLRNGRLLAIAPAGSISLLAGGVSSGIEPIFAAVTRRHLRDLRGEPQSIDIHSVSLSKWRETTGETGAVPPFFLTANEISPMDQLAMQAAVQPLVDGAVSKTVTLPQSATDMDVEGLILEASRLEIKGCSFFSPGASNDNFLSASERSCADTSARTRSDSNSPPPCPLEVAPSPARPKMKGD